MQASRKICPLGSVLNSEYIPGLDGLRAIAIFVVMTYHYGFQRVPGDLGVEMFFVLSGFLITRGLLIEYRQAGSINLSAFHHRRMLRIFPAYYLYLVVTFTEECVRGYCWSPGLLLAGLAQVVNYYNAFNNHPGTVIAHAWALSLQEQFYILWPVMLVFLTKRGKGTILWWLMGSILVVVSWRFLLTAGFETKHSYLYNALDTRLDSLFLGCMIAVLADFPGVTAGAATLAKSSIMPLITLMLLLTSRLYGSQFYHYTVGFTVDTALIAILVVQVISLHKHWMWAWLDLPILRYLGRISYSLYLWHIIGFGIVNRISNLPFMITFALGIFVCITLASSSYWFIERPFLRLKERLKVQSYGRFSFSVKTCLPH